MTRFLSHFRQTRPHRPLSLGDMLKPEEWYMPLRASVSRAVSEATIGAIIISALVALLSGWHEALRGLFPGPSSLVFIISLWMVGWPAWRLRRIRSSHFWTRWSQGIGRTFLLGITLGLIGQAIIRIFQIDIVDLSRNAGAVIVSIFVYGWARFIVLVIVGVGRLVRRRLRWQLMVSHLAVILLTFTLLTGLASIMAVNVVIANGLPRPQEVATALADAVKPQGRTSIDQQWTTSLLQGMKANRVQLHERSIPALVSLAIGNQLDIGMAVLNLDGSLIAATTFDHSANQQVRGTLETTPLPHQTWQAIHAAALAGKSATLTVPWTSGNQRDVIGMAPVLNAAGKPVAIALVQTEPFDLTTSEFYGVTLALFGVATLTLIGATSVLTLGLSALFGYLFARGLTRRLEAVSRAATAIAAGDLTRRTPVKAYNEIGQLARDFNQMAGHLETTMGELQQARTQAVDALQARQQLVASISHELRTPLAVIRAHLETLLLPQRSLSYSDNSGGGAPEQTLALTGITTEHPILITNGILAPPPPMPEVNNGSGDNMISVPTATLRALQGETDRLAALVDDLFSLSRVETGAVQVHCTPTDIVALVRDVATLMRPLAQNEGKITLTVETPPSLPPALIDGNRLRQILENLIRNAVRYTPEGGIIALSASLEESWVVVTVADTGEGIPAEHLQRIFDRFYRVDQARTRTSGGIGLGLAIVREFVELMGGHVTVQSKPGEGSCFHVYLPLASA